MKQPNAHMGKRWRFLAAGAITLTCSSCVAMSRMGNAEVTEANGLPCFSIPLDRTTRQGVALETLYVSETRSPDNGVTLPAELWHITANESAALPTLRPPACIPYGHAPGAMTQRTFKPLKVFHPYHVGIRTQPSHSGRGGYSAEFCLKPDTNGRVRVLMVPRDGSSEDDRFSVCARPS